VFGGLLLAVLLVLVLTGEDLTQASPYQTHGVMMVEGKIGAPPYRPSATFPWGTDYIGRDIQAIVLAGGKRTLTLAFSAMLSRLLIGFCAGRTGRLGTRRLARPGGQWRGGCVGGFPGNVVCHAPDPGSGYPAGMWVFVVALSVVGWGEVAQFVRGQVIALKPQPFVESARSVGARFDQILARHILLTWLTHLSS